MIWIAPVICMLLQFALMISHFREMDKIGEDEFGEDQ
jgi:hypothetical protein